MSEGGVQIAYSSSGKGLPILKAPNWLNHIEYEVRGPLWSPFLKSFSEKYELIRFDQRGNGLSDWEVEEISEDSMITDMRAVVDSTNINNFAIKNFNGPPKLRIKYFP